MPEGDFNKELNEIGILIQKGGTQGIHKVIKKLTSTQNPMLEQAIESMILQASKNPNSPYAMLVDKDGSINYNATTKISQITNPTDFIHNLDELEAKGIPFSEADVEDVITDSIEAEIAELEEMTSDTSEMTEEEVEAKQREVEAKASMIETTLSGVAKVGKAAVVVKVLRTIRGKVTSTIGGLFSKLFRKKTDAKVKADKKSELANGTGKKDIVNNNSQNKELGKDATDKEKVEGDVKTQEAPKKSRENMTIDEKIAEESKDNPWIIPELRKGVKMKDGVEVKYNPVELQMEKKSTQAADDLPGNIDDGPGSSDSENDFDDDFR